MDRILYKEADGDITCRSRDFDKVFPTLYAYEELEMTPEEIENTLQNFSSFLMEMTGGQMSKTNYTLEAMVTVANDYQQREIDELEQKLEQVKAELDAALADLNEVRPCTLCKNHHNPEICRTCMGERWEWRGRRK